MQFEDTKRTTIKPDWNNQGPAISPKSIPKEFLASNTYRSLSFTVLTSQEEVHRHGTNSTGAQYELCQNSCDDIRSAANRKPSSSFSHRRNTK